MDFLKDFFSKKKTADVDGEKINKAALETIQKRVGDIYMMFQYAEKYQPFFNGINVYFDPTCMQKYRDHFYLNGEVKELEVIFDAMSGDIITASIRGSNEK